MRVAVVLAIALALGVQATFASSSGFSGRNADCTVCHMPAAPQPATATLDAPVSWSPGMRYTLHASVSGGPEPLLPFRPQGGFELEADAGHFIVDDPAMYRAPRDGVITYEPPATSFRAWALTWQAPPAWQEPAPVTFWLAAMAANGDHDAELNRSDGGERGDAVDTFSITIPADPAAVARWQALPLERPVIDRATATATGWRIEGSHHDANATHLAIQRGDVERRIETGSTWVVELEGNLDGAIRAEGAGRVSPEVVLSPPGSEAPAPWVLAPLLVAVLARRFK